MPFMGPDLEINSILFYSILFYMGRGSVILLQTALSFPTSIFTPQADLAVHKKMGSAGRGKIYGEGVGKITSDSFKFSDFDLYPSGGPCSTQEEDRGGGGKVYGEGVSNISSDSSKLSDFDLYPSGGPCSTQEEDRGGGVLVVGGGV